MSDHVGHHYPEVLSTCLVVCLHSEVQLIMNHDRGGQVDCCEVKIFVTLMHGDFWGFFWGVMNLYVPWAVHFNRVQLARGTCPAKIRGKRICIFRWSLQMWESILANIQRGKQTCKYILLFNTTYMKYICFNHTQYLYF